MAKFFYHLKRANNWPTILFLLLTPPLGALGTYFWIVWGKANLATIYLALFFLIFSGLGITVGYHRLFAHRSFRTNYWLEVLFLIAGGMAWQGSALDWCLDHRIHHQKIDTDEDPYSIKKGFWYAHLYWLFYKRKRDESNEKNLDLYQKHILFQDRYYVILAFLFSFLLPTLLAGLFWGDYWGGFFIAGILRTVLNHHFTFAINSVCHSWGSQPYNDRQSGRDNFITAFFTYGEGYHNFHHEFASDYRNGIYWYQWDPSKWLIFLLSKLGLAHNLKRTPKEKIIMRKLNLKEKKIFPKLKGELLTLWQKQKQEIETIRQKLVNLRKKLAQIEHLKKEKIVKKIILRYEQILEKKYKVLCLSFH